MCDTVASADALRYWLVPCPPLPLGGSVLCPPEGRGTDKCLVGVVLASEVFFSTNGEGVLLSDNGIELLLLDLPLAVVSIVCSGVVVLLRLLTGILEDLLTDRRASADDRRVLPSLSYSSSSSGSSLMEDDTVGVGVGNFNCSLMCLARLSDYDKLRSPLVSSLPPDSGPPCRGGLELLIEALGSVYEWYV